MVKKILIVSSVASMIKKFNLDNIIILEELGFEISVATNFEDPGTISVEELSELKEQFVDKGIDYYQIDFVRGIGNLASNKKALNQLKELSKLNFDLMHCHSPIGAALGRFSFRKSKTKIIYTAHGFHFYKGAPKQNWAVFYPIEKYLSKFTDTFITINKEDYEQAKKWGTSEVEYVPGVGIDLENIINIDINLNVKRQSLGVPTDSIVISSVGELNKNKNHQFVIKALAKLNNTKVHYIICGHGNKIEELKTLARELKIDNKVHFLGYRNDIIEVLKASDIFVFPSYREGLPVSLMEAMACGLPCLASDIRGSRDLIDDGFGGELFQLTDTNQLQIQLDELVSSKSKRVEFGMYNKNKIQNFSLNNVRKNMENIYKKFALT